MSENYLEERNKFFENAKNDLQGVSIDKIFYLVEKAVKTNNPKLLKYESLVSIGAENIGKKLKLEDLKHLLTKVYTIWWNNWLVPKCQSNTSFQNDTLNEIIRENDCNPNLKNLEDDIFEVISYVYGNINQNALSFSGNNFLLLDVNSMFSGKQFIQYCDARIYLNIKLKNLPLLAEKFVDNAITENAPLLFKFARSDKRNDNVVIYSRYKDLEKIVAVIEKTKQDNPELFDGCKVRNPLMATYKEYMGFGEEPLKFGTSYNSIRADILKKMYSVLSKKYKNDKDYLSKNNMQKCFEKTCKKYKVDSKEFYKNQDETLENELKIEKK
ncbi:MAG: hypothetical protein IKR12_00180 [Clostridia bacterium]|nr:hypothetical protein [Clostridia bacterium]